MKINSHSFKGIAGIKTNIRLLDNVQEYVDIIEYLRETFDVDKPWYRGVSHAKYELIPMISLKRRRRSFCFMQRRLICYAKTKAI